MRQGFADMRAEMRQGLVEVRTEMREGLASVRTEMREGLASVRGEMQQGFADVQQGFADVQQGFAELHQGMAAMGRRLDALDERVRADGVLLEALRDQVQQLAEAHAMLDQRVERYRREHEVAQQEILTLLRTSFQDLARRVTRLEARIGESGPAV
jgi:chromosome segregation ATPase